MYEDGSEAGTRSDDYVRITVFLASVLFLVGIASHLRLRAARVGLVGVGAVMLVIAVVQLLAAPKPPTLNIASQFGNYCRGRIACDLDTHRTHG